MQLKSLINKRYVFYGGSIVMSRGLEYFVLFFAAHYLSKSDYGELEYYKKIIEVGSSVLAFGFPALILSYTKSKDSKVYFYFLSILFVLILGGILSFSGLFSPLWFLLVVSMVFYALFFSGGITQSFQIVHLGSNYASLYKIIISLLFYLAVFGFVFYGKAGGEAYLYPSLFLLPLALGYAYYEIKKEKPEWLKLKKYWSLFKKLLLNSFTLVVSNFANMMFLYTDIFVIRLLSSSPNDEIADFSFALNVASVLLIVSTTLIQVDIESLKHEKGAIKVLRKKINWITISMSLVLIAAYYFIIHTYYQKFENTFLLFLIILIGKLYANFANLYGTNLVILKKFRLNLNINLVFLALNIVGCWIGYQLYGIIGLAISSSLMLVLRYFVLYYFNRMFHKN